MWKQNGWEIARAAIASGLYKTIILDELNHVDLQLLEEEPCASPTPPRATEVIITGRCQNPPAYFDLAEVLPRSFVTSTTQNRRRTEARCVSEV